MANYVSLPEKDGGEDRWSPPLSSSRAATNENGDPIPVTLMTDSAALAALCARLADEDYITVDTEFLRERTYWAQLCLIQIAGKDDAVAIDPLAPGIDLQPLFDLLSAPKPLKVFHAARQDLEIFVQMMGCVPAPLFDTQVAAMVCGFGEQASYETLAAKLAKAKIDKAHRFTDWSARPLSSPHLHTSFSFNAFATAPVRVFTSSFE